MTTSRVCVCAGCREVRCVTGAIANSGVVNVVVTGATGSVTGTAAFEYRNEYVCSVVSLRTVQDLLPRTAIRTSRRSRRRRAARSVARASPSRVQGSSPVVHRC